MADYFFYMAIVFLSMGIFFNFQDRRISQSAPSVKTYELKDMIQDGAHKIVLKDYGDGTVQASYYKNGQVEFSSVQHGKQ